jgi:cell division protease FtsH
VSGGHTAFRADDAKLEAGVRTARDLLAEMAVAMGGRMAEEMLAGRAGVSSGAEADLEGAWHLSRAFVGRWGMSALGPIHVSRRGEGGPSESADGRVASEEHRLMRLAAEAAGAVLRANRRRHAALVRGLLANETLCRADLDELLDAHEPAAWSGSGSVATRRARQLPGSAAFDALSRRSLELSD